MSRKLLGSGLVVCFLCFLCGCTFFQKNKTPVVKADKIDLEDSADSIGTVKDKARLVKGGNLLFVPFRAGSAVAATPELDQLSLSVVQGFAETLNKKSTPFYLLNAGNADTAELILKGHFTKISNSGKIKKWMGMKSVVLGVEGKLIDRQTGEVVAHFSVQRSVKSKGQGRGEAAYGIGQEIAQFFIQELANQ